MSDLNKAGQNKIGKRGAYLKKALFYLLTLLLPVLFFVLLEAGLRAAGYGKSYPLFVPVEGYPQYLRPSADVAGRYFEKIENLPGIPFDSFKARKDSSAFRIFVQGGSTAAGFPFYFGGSFPDMLEQRLLQTFPGRTIEVINTAMAAVNSHTLADFVDEVIAQDPDLVLIYAGHNEYYGALGVGSSESLGRSPRIVRLYLKLRRLRVVQGLRSVLAGVVGAISGAQSSEDDSGGTLMKRMVGEQRIPFGSSLFFAGLRQFEFNLSDILARYDAVGVPVLIGSVVSNERDQRPFMSGLSPKTDEESFQSSLRTVTKHMASADTSAALAGIRQLIEIDSLAAMPFYLEAKLLDRPGSYDRARLSYKRAKDRDELRFRAPEEINRIIREAASRTGAILV
ncbi:MAG: SGNH/GDSL hydrolase family protein, partial [Rhodothermia bacterium]|nr:SGNH/GDSL hydrolase family protein [Rhodothermia bacterium]